MNAMHRLLVLGSMLCAACASGSARDAASPAPAKPVAIPAESGAPVVAEDGLLRIDVLERMSAPENGARYRVRVDNESATTFHFEGYSADSPRYELERWTGDGWVRHAVGWCGTGMAPRALPPGSSLELEVGVRADPTLRVGVAFATEPGAPGTHVWSGSLRGDPAAEPVVASEREEPLRIEVVEQIAAGRFPKWRLRMVNDSESPFRFRGYALSAPLYETEQMAPEGWQRHGGMWCGTGVEDRELAPGEQVEFAAGSWGPGPFRFGVAFRGQGDEDRTTTWTGPVSRRQDAPAEPTESGGGR